MKHAHVSNELILYNVATYQVTDGGSNEEGDDEGELEIVRRRRTKAEMTRDLLTVFTDWETVVWNDGGVKTEERGRWCLVCR